MRDPVRVNYGKGVQATVERETAEAEGLRLAADQKVWAHGRLRGTTIKGEPDVSPSPDIPTQTSGDVAGGAASKTPAKAKPSAKKE